MTPEHLEQIWRLPPEKRLSAFVERWEELNERAGCRTHDEIVEMAWIAEATMGRLIALAKESPNWGGGR